LYSRALLALEEGRQSFALAATGGDLKSRIEQLLPQPHGARTELFTVVPVLLLLAALLSTLTLLAQAPAPQQHQSPHEKWANQDVVYIMTGDERTRWETLGSNEEREEFIRQFWLRRDPVPATPWNEMKEEHYRRIAYANERFWTDSPGWRTPRGQMYIVYGPPKEIESHPRGPREVWFYADGSEYEFTGNKYELTRQRPAQGTGPQLMQRIIVDRLPEPQRSQLRARLASFVGQPMSNALMEQMRIAVWDIDRTLTFTWRLDPVTRHHSLELSHDPMPPAK
jgi:GWxTD domain-containing protein